MQIERDVYDESIWKITDRARELIARIASGLKQEIERATLKQ